MDDLYDFMQANLSDVLSTVDGLTYTLFVDLIIGNETIGGCLVDAGASLEFEEGYTYSFSEIGGYIDLAGATVGGGEEGADINPLSIENAAGREYNPGENVSIYSTIFDSSTGNLVDATINTTIYYPNGTIWVNGNSQKITTGFYKFNSTLPDAAPTGAYPILITATGQSGTKVNDILVFQVSTPSEGVGGAGGLALNMFNSIGATYSSGDIVKLFTTTVNSSGALVNSTVNVMVFYPNGTQLISGQAVQISEGRTEYLPTLNNS